MTSIHLRCLARAARIVPWHWQGNLINGAMYRAPVASLPERSSRCVMPAKVDGGCATDIVHAFKRRPKFVPESMRKTSLARKVPRLVTAQRNAALRYRNVAHTSMALKRRRRCASCGGPDFEAPRAQLDERRFDKAASIINSRYARV